MIHVIFSSAATREKSGKIRRGKKNKWQFQELWRTGGEGGIRTHGTLSRTHAFQACALNHSATSPLERPFEGRRGLFQVKRFAPCLAGRTIEGAEIGRASCRER